MATPSAQTESSPKENCTPLMRQYRAIKEQNPSAVLLYRMGDFYELFDDDARIASKVLGLTLTSRNHGGSENTPLAGFPYHALERYANKLVRAGHTIAVCEQVEDPKQAKGIVKRDIIEVITAGTATEESFIDERSNNFILSSSLTGDLAGVAVCDLSTGEFWVEEITAEKLLEELVRVDPSEVLISDAADNPAHVIIGNMERTPVVTRFEGWKFETDIAVQTLCRHFEVAAMEGLGLSTYSVGVCAAGALLQYLKEQKRSDLKHITAITPRSVSQWAELDPATIRNLELLRPLHSDDTEGTLVSVLDRTSTAMGARLLKRFITRPLKDPVQINRRLDCVEWFRRDGFTRGEVELQLRRIADIERLIGKVVFERANARDLTGLKNSLLLFPQIIKALQGAALEDLQEICRRLSGFDDLASRVAATLVDSPPLSIREGGIIRAGVSPELDELRDAAVNGKQWIAQLQESERRRTGISSLKVGYNRVFGYYIEVTKTNMASVPPDYIRKQTLVNGERFITPELKEMEEKILGAEERLTSLEYDIFCALRREVAKRCPEVQRAAEAIATLDVYICFGNLASEGGYSRPVLREDTELIIRDGRHPVVEKMNPQEQFVPNDTVFRSADAQILMITGPNMAGKSTYLRQNALIAIMAQIGSFVPAVSAEIGVVDKFFTRVGASDRLARGQSTFLVEMIEVANILNNATSNSLVLLDEVGRGTSTFDGISIAWAVAEYLHESEQGRPRTLFATHYHELAELSKLFGRIKNLHVKVKEWNDRIIFLRKIEEGSCDHSYGIQVARLAGVPRSVIVRAKEILANLERMELTPSRSTPSSARKKVGSIPLAVQTNLFSIDKPAAVDPRIGELLLELQALDVDAMTPLRALTVLSELRNRARLLDTPSG